MNLTVLKQAFSIKKNWRVLLFRDQTRYASIDGLRAISILILILFHFFYAMQFFLGKEIIKKIVYNDKFLIIYNSHAGVDIFFTISGFLIADILLREYLKTHTIDIKKFYVRRYIRLTPMYYIILLILLLVSRENSNMIWTNMIYIQNYFSFSKSFMPWSWSLAIEEQFYLVFPLLLLFLMRSNNNILIKLLSLLALAIAICLSTAIIYNFKLPYTLFPVFNQDKFFYFFDHFYQVTHERFGPFISGIVMAYLNLYHSEKIKRWLTKTSVSGLLVIVCVLCALPALATHAFYPSYHFSWLQSILYAAFSKNLFGVGVAILIALSLNPYNLINSTINKFFSAKFWYPIAQISYSAYLVHVLVIIAFDKKLLNDRFVFHIIPMISLFFLVVSVTFILATFFFMFVEKPLMNLRGSRSSAEIKCSTNYQKKVPDF